MEVKEKIEQVIDRAKNDETFHKLLHENPVSAVEELLGVDLPDEQVKAIVSGAKSKLNLDSAKETVENIGKTVENAVEGLLHKKD